MLPAIILFAATYVLMIAFGKYRPYFSLTAVVPAYVVIWRCSLGAFQMLTVCETSFATS